MTTNSNQEELAKGFHDLRFDVDVSERYHSRRRGFFDFINNFTLFVVLIANTAAFADVFPMIPLPETSLLTTVLVAITLVGRVSSRARDHDDLRRRFIELLQSMTKGREHMNKEMLAAWEAKRLEIEIGEPPINRVVHALCYNDVVKSLSMDESKKKYVKVRLHHRLFGSLTRVFDDRFKLESS